MIKEAWFHVPAAQVILVHLRIDMSVGEDEIGPAIIVKVKKHGAPAQILCVQTKSRGEGNIRKDSFTVIAVKGRRVIREIGLKNIQPSVAVVIRDGSSHARLLAPIFVEGYSCHHRNIGESAIAIVVIKNTWGTIAGYINIWPAIIVKVEGGNAEGIVSTGLVDMSLGGNIHEGPVTAILIQNILRARQTTWSAHHRHALPNARTSLARGWSSGQIESHIICHHQVEATVTIVVNESTPGTPGLSRSCYASLFGHFGENAMVIMIETILPVIRDVQIFPTIIIVISDANALTPSRGNKTGLHGDIRESPIMIVVIQVVGGSLIGWESFQCRAVHNENIWPSVVVIIKNGHPRSGCLDDVFLGFDSAKHIHRCKPRFFRDICEICDARIVVHFLRGGLRMQRAAEQEDHYGRPEQYFLYEWLLDLRAATLHAFTSGASNRSMDSAECDIR